MVTFITIDRTYRLRVIAKKILREFREKHRDCEQQLKAWYQEMNKAEWVSFNEIKAVYTSASIIGNGGVVFNIKGNTYRLIVRINFDYQIMWIRFVGTHAAYDTINASIV